MENRAKLERRRRSKSGKVKQGEEKRRKKEKEGEKKRMKGTVSSGRKGEAEERDGKKDE